jgi:hypothetical protein
MGRGAVHSERTPRDHFDLGRAGAHAGAGWRVLVGTAAADPIDAESVALAAKAPARTTASTRSPKL